MKRETWTVEPEADVRSLVRKEMNRMVGRSGNKRGLRTRIIHDALRAHLAGLKGKREAL